MDLWHSSFYLFVLFWCLFVIVFCVFVFLFSFCLLVILFLLLCFCVSSQWVSGSLAFLFCTNLPLFKLTHWNHATKVPTSSKHLLSQGISFLIQNIRYNVMQNKYYYIKHILCFHLFSSLTTHLGTTFICLFEINWISWLEICSNFSQINAICVLQCHITFPPPHHHF